jgi:DNA-directed RNA polymerase specialized sigma24 family protein
MANERQPVDLVRLRKAAAKLRPIEREVLYLSSAEELRNDAVAERLGITTEAAEGHLANALIKLDREMERQERPWWRFW